MISGASMWLDARAGAGSSRSPRAAVSWSVRTSDFITVSSRVGWCTDRSPEHPQLRRKQGEAQGVRLPS